MSARQRYYKPALMVLALIFFSASARMQVWLNQDRQLLGITKLTPLENAPPVLAFTSVALGGFRGLIANALWIRASDMQENEKYFEMVQLADWITKLEPHFVQVWLEQAWNMSYNISVKFKDPEDRWRWVMRGITLLRDEGLKYNPDETLIYREISWLFQHKIGQNLDDAHMTYKYHWAEEMNQIFTNRASIADLANPQSEDSRRRAQKLREIYKMDPKLVLEVDKLYGPLDWRLPDAHSIYWAELGRRTARPKDQETLRRSIYQTMQQACVRGGTIRANKIDPKQFMLGPNLDLVPTVSAAYEKMIAEESSIQLNMMTGHKNFLLTAIFLLYSDDRKQQAQYWFDYVKKKYPPSIQPPNMTLEDFAVREITSSVAETDMHEITAVIEGLLRTEFLRRIMDEDEQAVNYHSLAQRVWSHYNSQIKGAANNRVDIGSLDAMRAQVLKKMLDPDGGMSPEYATVLRIKLKMLGIPDPTVVAPAVPEAKK